MRIDLQLSHACCSLVVVRDKGKNAHYRKGEQMFVDKETRELAEALAEKLREMAGGEGVHQFTRQWLNDTAELLGQLS